MISLCKNFFIRLLLVFLRKEHNPHYQGRERFLLISTTGMGDTLWASPVISAIRNKYPLAKIDLLSSKVGCALLQNNPHLSEIIPLKEPLFFFFFSLRKKLLEDRYTHILLLHASQRLTFALAASIGARELISTEKRNKGLDFLFTKLTSPKEHELHRREEICSSIGASFCDYSLSYQIDPSEKEEGVKLRAQLTKDGKKPLVILHPGAKDSYKCWSRENYISLGRELSQKAQIFVGYGPGEETRAQEVKEKIPDAISFALTVRSYAALIDQADLLITNDTGPMHLACALQKEVIAIFAPTSPTHSGPINVPSAHLFAKPRTCTPCLKRKCRDPFCLRQIGVHEILVEAQRILQ